MDKKQLKQEFTSILSESHPGLTFEEYRDSCIFLLFYHYLCVRYDDQLDDNYKLNMMVRLALRGKLQMDTFLRFIQNASPFLHFACQEFTLTELSFYRELSEVETLEKQKSYARFFRKLIKKMNLWTNMDHVLDYYPECFEGLIQDFASMKKETNIPVGIQQLFQSFSSTEQAKDSRRVFQPEFHYGILLRSLLQDCSHPYICGYDQDQKYIELISMVCFMKNIPFSGRFFQSRKDWLNQKKYHRSLDTICLYMPEGVDAGTCLCTDEGNASLHALLNLKAKGELPFLLSAYPLLAEDGDILAILPSALLYREGREGQIRKYLVEDLHCLDTIILLPDSFFPSLGQQEVFLYIKKNRKQEDIMFFDCSNRESFDESTIREILKARQGKKNITGFCNHIAANEIADNDYNLNLPRYIKKPVGLEAIDINAKKKRIEEINAELREIDARIEMYRRDLELDALI